MTAKTSIARTEPIEGRCNATTRAGPCRNRPLTGATRCRAHGGLVQERAAWTKALDLKGQEEIARRLKDPGIFDTRRPVALAEYVASSAPLVLPREQLVQLARRRVARQVAPDLVDGINATVKRLAAADDGSLRDIGEALQEVLDAFLEPTDGDIAEAAIEYAERAERVISVYGKRQSDAVKTNVWSDTIRERMMPVISEITIGVAGLLKRFVPAAQLEAALDGLRATAVQSVGRLSSTWESS